MKSNLIGGRIGGDYLIDILDEFGLASSATMCLDFSDPACYPGTGQTIYDTGKHKGSLTWTVGSTTGVDSREPTFADGVANNHPAGKLGSRFFFSSLTSNPPYATGTTTRLTANTVSFFNNVGTSGSNDTFICVFRNIHKNEHPYDATTRSLLSVSKTSGTNDWFMTAANYYDDPRVAYRRGSDTNYSVGSLDVTPSVDRVYLWANNGTTWQTRFVYSENPDGGQSTWPVLNRQDTSSTASAVYVGNLGWSLHGTNAMVGRIYCAALLEGPDLQISDLKAIMARLKTRFAEI